MGLSGRFTHIYVILNCLGQVLFLGRAPRTKETLPDFREQCRFTRCSQVFRGLTGCQRTPGDRGVTGPVEPKQNSASRTEMIKREFHMLEGWKGQQVSRATRMNKDFVHIKIINTQGKSAS